MIPTITTSIGYIVLFVGYYKVIISATVDNVETIGDHIYDMATITII